MKKHPAGRGCDGGHPHIRPAVSCGQPAPTALP